MNFHPYSEVFPLIEGNEFEALVEDIKTHGLREKIWLYEGKILDGRNRFLACKKAKTKPLFRKYAGKNPLAFVVSANVHRRHLTESQRAMAAARVANMTQGARTDLASIEAKSQTDAATTLNVGRSSVQRARKVVEQGSKALQQAVENGEVSVSKAASVVDLPKSEQLAAAKEKPKAIEPDDPPREDGEPDEDEKLAATEKELTASIDKVMLADDRLAAAYTEIKRQAAEIAVLKLSRDGYMNGKATITRLLKSEQTKCEKLARQLQQANSEIEKLRERVSIMEVA